MVAEQRALTNLFIRTNLRTSSAPNCPEELTAGDGVSANKVHWVTQMAGRGAQAPAWLGLSIAIAYLLLRCAFDGLFLASWGFPDGFQPLWRSDIWWAELVNAALLGYIPAVLVIARHGINNDLRQLKPWLPGGDAEATDIKAMATRPAQIAGWAFMLSGVVGGFALVYIDPSFSLHSEQSLTNPVFLWPLLRTPLFTWLICLLIVADLQATRSYYHMGRKLIKIDLLDLQGLTAFARRGLRSALIWVVFSMIFSLFWVGDDTASRQNLALLIILLSMAIGAFVTPLLGVHNNILSVKRAELARLLEEIRNEANSALPGEEHTSPRLANLIAYYQLVDKAREWPIDVINLLRFFMYLLIGLGSWLGGAVVERMLDLTLAA